MNPMNVVIDLMQKKGQIVTFKTKRQMKVKKGNDPIEKESIFQCRVGVDYDNIKNVKEKRENGELPEENAGLPWGEWVKGMFPYVIKHKDEYYFRCTTLRNNVKTKTKFYDMNGKEVTYDDVKQKCLASEFRHDDNDVFTVKVSSIKEINNISVE